MSDGPVPHPAPAVTAEAGGGDDTAARIAAAVLAVEDVVGLSAGPAGQFRTYLPGGASVAGVRVDDERIAVDVVVRYGPSLPELGDRVAAALTGIRSAKSQAKVSMKAQLARVEITGTEAALAAVRLAEPDLRAAGRIVGDLVWTTVESGDVTVAAEVVPAEAPN